MFINLFFPGRLAALLLLVLTRTASLPASAVHQLRTRSTSKHGDEWGDMQQVSYVTYMTHNACQLFMTERQMPMS